MNDIKGSSKEDNARAMIDNIHALTDQGDYPSAVSAGIKGLADLGIRLGEAPGMWPLLLEINRVKRKFSLRKINRILSKGAMTSELDLLRLNMLASLAYPAMRTNMSLWQMVMLKMAALSMAKGNGPGSVLGYAAFGETALAYLDEEPMAEAMNGVCTAMMSEQVTDNVAAAMAALILGSGSVHIFSNWQETLKVLEFGAAKTEVSNRSLSFLCAVRSAEMSFASGMPLEVVREHLTLAEGLRSDLAGNGGPEMMDLYLDFMDTLEHGSEPFDPEMGFKENDTIFQLPVFLTRLLLKCVCDFGMDRFEEAMTDLEGMRIEWKKLKISFVPGLIYGMEALALCRHAVDFKYVRTMEKRRLYQLRSLFAYWVRKNPYAYGHVYKVIEGCCMTLDKRFHDGEQAYEMAIVLAEENNSLLWKAMAQKMLGHHCRYLGREHLATHHMQKASESYGEWGHISIAEHLMAAEGLRLSPDEVGRRWADDEHHNAEVTAQVLTLTGKMNLMNLSIEKAMSSVIAEYLESDRLMVLIEGSEGLVSHADDRPLDDYTDISKKAVAHAFKNLELIVINEDRNHKLATYDAYLLDHGDRCVLAAPMAFEEEVMGVVYSERGTSYSSEEQDVVMRVCDHVAYRMKVK